MVLASPDFELGRERDDVVWYRRQAQRRDDVHVADVRFDRAVVHTHPHQAGVWPSARQPKCADELALHHY